MIRNPYLINHPRGPRPTAVTTPGSGSGSHRQTQGRPTRPCASRAGPHGQRLLFVLLGSDDRASAASVDWGGRLTRIGIVAHEQVRGGSLKKKRYVAGGWDTDTVGLEIFGPGRHGERVVGFALVKFRLGNQPRPLVSHAYLPGEGNYTIQEKELFPRVLWIQRLKYQPATSFPKGRLKKSTP